MCALITPVVNQQENTLWIAVRTVVHVAQRLQYQAPSPECLTANLQIRLVFNLMNNSAAKFSSRHYALKSVLGYNPVLKCAGKRVSKR